MKDVLITYDYYAYGSVMPGRNGNSGDYRYGFNGYENDNEVKNITGGHLDFAGYGYDPRLGKRWNVDPKTKSYPHQSPYVFAANSPIQMVDVEGEHDDYYMLAVDKSSGKAVIHKLTVENSDLSHRTHFQIHVKDKDGSVKSYDVGRKAFGKISNQFVANGKLGSVPSRTVPESQWKQSGIIVWGKGGEAFGEGELLDEAPLDGAPMGPLSGKIGNGLLGALEFMGGLNAVVEGFIDYFQSEDTPEATSTPVSSKENNSINLPNNGQIDGGKVQTPMFNENDSCKNCFQKGENLDTDLGNPGLHDIVPVENPQ